MEDGLQVRIVPVDAPPRKMQFPCTVHLGDGRVAHGIMGFRTETVRYVQPAPPPAPIRCWPCQDAGRMLAPALDGPCPHCQGGSR